MRIREAGPRDLPSIMALENGAFGPWKWTEDLVRDKMDDPAVRTLVTDDGEVVGYIMFSIDRAYETGEVLSLAVHPRRLRKGLGRGLMEAFEREAAAAGACTAALCVRPDNSPAVNLYLSLGYRVLAICAAYYEDGSDAHMMVKHLED